MLPATTIFLSLFTLSTPSSREPDEEETVTEASTGSITVTSAVVLAVLPSDTSDTVSVYSSTEPLPKALAFTEAKFCVLDVVSVLEQSVPKFGDCSTQSKENRRLELSVGSSESYDWEAFRTKEGGAVNEEPPSSTASSAPFSIVSLKEAEPVMPELCKGTAVKV